MQKLALTAAIVVALTAPAWSAQLSQSQLVALLSDHSILGMNEMGQTYRQCYKLDHVVTGVSNNTAGPQTDTGTWSVRDGKLCTKWDHWRNATEQCNTINFENNTYA